MARKKIAVVGKMSHVVGEMSPVVGEMSHAFKREIQSITRVREGVLLCDTLGSKSEKGTCMFEDTVQKMDDEDNGGT